MIASPQSLQQPKARYRIFRRGLGYCAQRFVGGVLERQGVFATLAETVTIMPDKKTTTEGRAA